MSIFGGGVPGTGGAGGITPSSFTAYQQQLQNQQNQTGQQNQANNNVYSGAQQGAQAQAAQGLSGLSAGAVPTSYTQPAQLISAYNQQFAQNVAPSIAAQYGAGSPQLASQNAIGLQNLLAGQFNTGVGEEQNALNSQAAFGLTPQGQTVAAQNAQQGTASQGTQGTQGNGVGSILSLLLGLI